MTAIDRFDPFERRITEAIDEIAATRTPAYLDDVLRQTVRRSQRPRWTFPGSWLPAGLVAPQGIPAAGTRLRPLLILALIGLLGAAAIGVGSLLDQRLEPPSLRGVFVPAGGLPSPGRIALPQPDGGVLIFGGRATAENGLGSLGATPEAVLLYDPVSGVSREIGTTSASVSFAVPLADGRILAIELAPSPPGGGSGGRSQAELIDPGTGRVVFLGPTSQRHLVGAGVRLRDGRVLLVGDAVGTTEAELFDPATGTFGTTGSTTAPMMQPTATLLSDGRVLVVGAREPTAEIYDPATGTFSRAGSMSGPHEDFTATLLPDGRVLIVGGWATNGTVIDGNFFPSEPARLGTTGEIFDPAAGRFSQVGPMVTPRVYHFAVALADGRVLIGGGSSADRTDAVVAEIFDPMTITFTPTGALGIARFGAGAVRLLDGRVIVVGSAPPAGARRDPDPLAASSLEIYQ